MRTVAFLLGAVLVAFPLRAEEPTPDAVRTAYGRYRTAICANASACPPGQTDIQAQIRLLKRYCNNGGAGVDCGEVNGWSTLPELTYDHQQRAWIAKASLEKRTELDINGTPTVDLGRGKTVVVVVTNTNPLLYSATAGKIELKPIDQLSDLQTLVSLLGGNAAAVLQVRSSERTLRGISDPNRGAVLTAVRDATDALSQAGNQYVAGQQLADCVTLSVQAATNFVQAVELKRNDTYPSDLPQCQGLSPTGSAVRALTPFLAQARSALARRCADLPNSVEALLAIDPPEEASVRVAIARYDAATLSIDCTAWSATPDVTSELEREIIDPIRDELKNSPPDLPALYSRLKEHEPAVRKLAAATKGAKGAEEALVKLIAALPTIGKAAENLDLFRERLFQNVVDDVVQCTGNAAPPCVPQSAVADFIIVPGGPTGVTRWESVHSRPIKIAADSPYAADVSSRLPGVDTSYNLRSPLASIFDIGVSMTDTDLQSPVFGAVRVDDGDGNLGNDKKVVGITDQESQAGKVALMLNVVPLRLWTRAPKLIQPLGVQVGAAVDTSKPALFWGVSYGLGKYVRVGWGRTSQRVSTLRDETPLGHQIADAGEIRKRQKYEKDEYWSLMISVRTLRLFTR